MESGVFIRILEGEYRGMMSEITGQWKKTPGSVEAYVSYIPDDRIARFKKWLMYALKTTEVTVSGVPTDTRDVLLIAASANESPTSLLPSHPNLIKMLSLYSDEELDEIFGERRMKPLLTALGRRI